MSSCFFISQSGMLIIMDVFAKWSLTLLFIAEAAMHATQVLIWISFNSFSLIGSQALYVPMQVSRVLRGELLVDVASSQMSL